MKEKLLSIIIPAYNEASRLPESLEKIIKYLKTQDYGYEILVIENGSSDNTLEIAQGYSEKYDFIRVIHEEKSGKGRAVQRGVREAQGEFCFMCDADLSMPIEGISKFLPPAIAVPQIVIGSREAEGAVRFNEPSYRHIGGRLINWVIRVFALPGFQDTQCGFKLFRTDIAQKLVEKQTMMGWSFDIELLFLARKKGYEIIEIPIDWYYAEMSHVKPVRDALRLIADIIKIRWRSFRGLY
jgi:glycosyltransferase involved in cell wall biosynthesis